MTAYFALILVIAIDFALENLLLNDNYSRTYNLKDLKTKKFLQFIFKWRIITIIGLVFISTFKSLSVGLDSKAYYRYYQSLVSNKDLLFKKSIGSTFEFGYTFLNSILAFSGADYWVLLFCISTFVSITLVFVINKLTNDKLMSLILYIALGVFAQSLNTNRQIIAMAFILLTFYMLYNYKWKQSLILILLASTFHISALFMFILVPLRYLKFNWKYVLVMFSATIIISFLFPSIMQIIEKLTPLDYYTKYFVNYRGFINSSNKVNNLYSIALILLFFTFYLFKIKFLQFNETDSKKYNFYLSIFIFVPLIRIMGFVLNAQALFNRLSMYFFMILIFLIPLFIKGLIYNKELYYAGMCMVYITSIGYMYYLYAIKMSCGVVPYVLGV